MPSLDGGHYFFTALMPIDNRGIVAHAHMKSSPVHMLREALETLPTALQSHATERIGIPSPFARSLRTHFLRLVVIDNPFYNGRDPQDAIVTAARGTDLLAAQPHDELACPTLLLAADFDPDAGGAAEPRHWLEELWQLAPRELTAIFTHCYGFAAVHDAASFAEFLIGGQVETTMPFNDYWTGAPKLPSLSVGLLALPPLAAIVLAGLAGYAVHSPWWGYVVLVVVCMVAAIGIDLAVIMQAAKRPFPAAPNSTLRDVLKALYLQQVFVRFMSDHQECDAATLRLELAEFLKVHRPADLNGPTQSPGVIGRI